MMKSIWITNAEYVDAYQIKLCFSDGQKGIVDLKESLKGPVFEPLCDISLFKSFTLNAWSLEWPNGADIAPEYLYDLVRQEQKVM